MSTRTIIIENDWTTPADVVITTIEEHLPRVRASTRCPNCFKQKDQGLVVCWSCHSKLKARYDGGYGSFMERRLERLEYQMAALDHVVSQDT